LSDITRIGVIGCGLMGAGIAEVNARAGLDVIVREIDDPALVTGRPRIQKSLDRARTAGKLAQADLDAALAASPSPPASRTWPSATSSSRPRPRTRRSRPRCSPSWTWR